ncbi:MAG: hypothetical protein WBA45_16370 [Microthrixaceae bacterium]
MSRSNLEEVAPDQTKRTGGLQARLLGLIAERQQDSAKGKEVWVEILQDRISVGGYRLETVLESVEERLGANAKILRTERQIIGGVRGFFGREAFVVEAALPKVSLPDPTQPAVPAPAVQALAVPAPAVPAPQGEGMSFAQALAKALTEVESIESALDQAMASESRSESQPEPEPESQPQPESEFQPESQPEPLAAPAPVHPARSAPRTEPQFRSGAAFLTLEAGSLSHDALVARIDDLMHPVVETPTCGIVAVVGDADECVSAARRLAGREGVDPGEVVVMSPEPIVGHPSWMCVTTIDDGARRRARWSDDKRLHIVAVVLNAGPSGMEWACAALDSLTPDQTHLAVPGWRRVEDVVARLRSLAPITAIDLVGDTDPATAVGFLDLDVPVSTIAGADATPEVWSSYLAAASAPSSRLEQILLEQALTVSNGVENLR